MKVGIYSRNTIEMLLKTRFPENTAVISFYDPPGKFHDENYCVVDYKGKPTRLFQVAVHDIDLSVLSEYGLNYFSPNTLSVPEMSLSRLKILQIFTRCPMYS